MIDLFQESGSHNCGGWAGRSKTCQADSTRLEAQTGVDTAVLRQNFFFSKKSPVLLLRPSTDWIRPTQPMKDNLLHLKSADFSTSLGLVHWYDPEGWNGEGGGRRVQDGEHM